MLPFCPPQPPPAQVLHAGYSGPSLAQQVLLLLLAFGMGVIALRRTSSNIFLHGDVPSAGHVARKR
eukprot:5170464-Amphidinium_carterae.1